MKKLLSSFIIGFLISSVMGIYSGEVNASLSQNLLRLHVIANSDAAFDQALKLKVRDRIIKESSPLFKECKSASECEEVLLSNMEFLKSVAMDEIKNEGYCYDVNISFEKTFFPTKKYENIMLPAGEYNALRVFIGEGKGQNWWCVLFPPLCFLEGSSGTISQESSALLKENLPPDDYDLITSGKVPVKIKFKIVELFQELTR